MEGKEAGRDRCGCSLKRMFLVGITGVFAGEKGHSGLRAWAWTLLVERVHLYAYSRTPFISSLMHLASRRRVHALLFLPRCIYAGRSFLRKRCPSVRLSVTRVNCDKTNEMQGLQYNERLKQLGLMRLERRRVRSK